MDYPHLDLAKLRLAEARKAARKSDYLTVRAKDYVAAHEIIVSLIRRLEGRVRKSK